MRLEGQDSKESIRLERTIVFGSQMRNLDKEVAKAIPTHIMNYFKIFKASCDEINSAMARIIVYTC